VLAPPAAALSRLALAERGARSPLAALAAVPRLAACEALALAALVRGRAGARGAR
jgi:hypothetical protein